MIFSSPKALWLHMVHFRPQRQHRGPLLTMNSTNKVKPSSHNEMSYCLARHKTSAPFYLTCTKVEKNQKNQCLLLLTERVVLSPHIKTTSPEASSSFA